MSFVWKPGSYTTSMNTVESTYEGYMYLTQLFVYTKSTNSFSYIIYYTQSDVNKRYFVFQQHHLQKWRVFSLF